MRKILTIAATLCLLSVGAAQAFTIEFDWAGLKSCTSGNPNTVANPEFVLKNVPAGTAFIRFKLIDRNVPDFNHGGGVVSWAGEATVKTGAFKYKSPCPPNGSHNYEWTATAQSKKNGGALAKAKASRNYPE